MASFDTSSNCGTATTGTTLNWSHTCGTGVTLLVVATHNVNGTTTSATYNGIAMSRVLAAGSSYNLFYLEDPAIGSHNIVVTREASTRTISAVAASYIGLGTPVDSFGNDAGTGNTLAVSTTVVAENCWLIGAAIGRAIFNSNLASDLAETRETFTNDDALDSSKEDVLVCDSDGTVATGSQTMNLTQDETPLSIGGVLASFPPYSSKAAGFFMISD